MALLAESLVEEWLNREGYFTIRGVKHGINEMDLLAVKQNTYGSVAGKHVEVQVSFRPVGYICKLLKNMTAESGISRSSARARTPHEVELCAREWIDSKFRSPEKVQLREQLWPGVIWSFHLVHAVVRETRELDVFKAENVICHEFHDLLTTLSQRSKHSFSGSAGGDIAEIVSYYNSHKLKHDA